MKIKDLDLERYVIVYDIGESECSDGMTIVGKVIELEFDDYDKNKAVIESMQNEYEITDDNEFELWTKSIEDKTESVSIQNKETGEIVSSGEVKATIDLSNSEFAHLRKSNDLQQRKRNEQNVKPDYYQFDDFEMYEIVEAICKHYNPIVAAWIGQAIQYIGRAPRKNGKEDIGKARDMIEQAFKSWDK
ncbi:hypothetical protein BU055_02075 [Staphylococcus succinus]|uniref:DUF3310 domain-containing protein n=1 Tax=Staphylococcus succinus TaxID=61015 RepID=UPI000D1E789F|nr:DUF3310 domain-containing protein [Staphylococcus succinus]PTJ85096.1 hypothetical protein BU055_02075 [Staphylococcus succinus]